MQKLLLCTDLDRTLLPNGQLPESPQARPHFSQLVAHQTVCLAYVSGRHRALVERAILQYQLPTPDFVIADVGATLYQIQADQWIFQDGWKAEIAHDWLGKTAKDLRACFWDMDSLTLQEDEKQGRYKLSYYYPLEQNTVELVKAVESLLEKYHYRGSIICSVDEERQIGLLDILPPKANKRQAIEYLMQREHYSLDETIFAGDSGNDLSVLTSPILAVLVANARAEVKAEARTLSKGLGYQERLYIAQGNVLGMNGNYSAGILEGLAHYFPDLMSLIHT